MKNYTLITGATSGIGYELAKLFAKDHHNLILVARDQSELDRVQQELSAQDISVITLAKDLFIKEQVFDVYYDIQKKGLNVDVLVNNAGQGVYGLFEDNNIERELNIINLNVSALVILTKCFLQDMVKRNSGKILNLASIASKSPGPWQAVYHGTKAFVLSFTEAIREELRSTEITVTALLPGVTDTDFFNKAGMQESKAIQDPDSMADPADVAKDGYEALMAGKDKIVSGLKNKLQTTIGNLIPDSVQAHQVAEQQKPITK